MRRSTITGYKQDQDGGITPPNEVVLSQQHRVLSPTASVELSCRESEFLVRASHLLNGQNVRLDT